MKLTRSDKLATYPILITSIIGVILLFLSGLLSIPILVNFSFSVFFIGLAITFFFIGIYNPLKLNKHPYIERPEDIQLLLGTLESEQVKKTIKTLYHDRGRSVIDIAWMLEKYLNIELHIKKGIRSGEIKSEVLYKKIDEILGINTSQLWRISIEPVYYIPTIFKIGVILIILGLIAVSITLLFIP